MLILAGLVALLVYNSAIQTFAVNTYLNSLSKKLKTTISVGKVDVAFFDEVNIYDLYAQDLKNDTLFYSEKINVEIEQFSYKMKLIELDEAIITNAYFNLKKYKNDTTTSLQFIIDHFKSDSKKKSDWVFSINNVGLENVRFNYIDENKDQKPYGVDFSHLSLTKVNSHFSKIKLIEKGVACTIDKLNLREKSGFILDTLMADAQVSHLGISTQGLKLTTPNSSVRGNVSFATKEYKDLANFIEDVKIKSDFVPTKVNFKDISYFAPTLEGVNNGLALMERLKVLSII